MLFLILGLSVTLVSLLLTSVQQAYYRIPSYELKRRARTGDHSAVTLYRAVAYGASLRALLWVLIGISSASSFVLLARALPVGIALSAVTILIWVTFVWLPRGRLSPGSAQLAIWVTPGLAKLLSFLHRGIDRVFTLAPGHRDSPEGIRRDIYEIEDLLALLDHQKTKDDSRIPANELEAAERILTFTYKIVQDAMVPRRQVKLVSADDQLGPVLLDELHESGQPSFIVYQDKKSHIVGTLTLHDALRGAQGGAVKDVMSAKVCYVNEEHPLTQVLHAFRTTKEHVFVVINKADEFVGIVTIEDALGEAIGEIMSSDFDAYEDRHSVATHHPPSAFDDASPPSEDPEILPSDPSEVVE